MFKILKENKNPATQNTISSKDHIQYRRDKRLPKQKLKEIMTAKTIPTGNIKGDAEQKGKTISRGKKSKKQKRSKIKYFYKTQGIHKRMLSLTPNTQSMEGRGMKNVLKCEQPST